LDSEEYLKSYNEGEEGGRGRGRMEEEKKGGERRRRRRWRRRRL